MNIRTTLLCLALCAASGGIATAQTPEYPLTEAEVALTLSNHGYTEITNLAFVNGMWEADATAKTGGRVDVRVDPLTGAVYPDERVSMLSEAEVRARLAAAGFSEIHDVDFDDGVWTAEADDPSGDDREIRLDPNTGKILEVEED